MRKFDVEEVKFPQNALEEIGYSFTFDKYGCTINDADVHSTLCGMSWDDMTDPECEEEQEDILYLLNEFEEENNLEFKCDDGNKSYYTRREE